MSTRKINNNNNAQSLGAKQRSGPRAPKGSSKNKHGQTIVPGKSKVHMASKPRSMPLKRTRMLTAVTPRQTMLKNGGTLIEMEEFVSPIFKPLTAAILDGSGGTLIKLLRLRINPGSAKTFTWLSSIAVNYEHYKFHKLEFCFYTRVGNISGSLIMSPDYDAEDGDIAVTEKSLFSNKGSTDETVNLDHKIVLKPQAMNRLFKAHSVMSDDRFDQTLQDTKTIDAAQLHVLVDSDATAPVKYGKLIVKYVVELTEPQNPTEPANKGGMNMYQTQFLQNGVLPFTSSVAVGTRIKSDVGVIKPAASIEGIAYPNATIGQFIKDYSGIISTAASGTGLSAFQKMYVSPPENLSLVAGSVGDVLQTVLNAQTGSSTFQQSDFSIIAKAGDLLRMAAPTGTTLTGLQALMGGSSALALDL